MTDEKKQEIRFSLIPTIEITDEEPRSFWSRSASQIVQSVPIQKKPSVPSKIPKFSPYTPPDTLMFPLFNAIQRKAWIRARKLCHELILCDPERKIYHDLYVRLDQIINLIEQRLHPRSAVSQATTASSDDGRSTRQRTE